MRAASLVMISLLLNACSGDERPGVNATGVPPGGAAPPIGGQVVADAGPLCSAMGTLCDGQTPYRCTSAGGREYQPACVETRPFCAPGIGCVACLAESLRCNPDRPDTPQRCVEGSRWADQTACDAAAGQRCTDGRCGDPCVVPEGVRPYLGCEYWATQTPNSQLYSRFPFAVALANPQSFEVTVRISGGALTETMEQTLASGEVRAITLPWVRQLVQFDLANPGCQGLPGTPCAGALPARSAVAQGGAYKVESTAPVAAYQFNPLTFERMNAAGQRVFSFTNDASLLLSARSLSQRYLVLTAPNWTVRDDDGRSVTFGGFIAVTAISGETTTVTVQLPPAHGVAEADARNVVRHDNLMPGDVALIVGARPGDLSGAIVEASSPVAVYAGHDCTTVPQTRPACDHLEEQVLPIEALGRDYVISDLRDRRVGSLVRMVSPSDGAVVRFDPPSVSPPIRMRAGEVVQLTAMTTFRVSATRPLLVAQFMLGQGPTTGMSGDPAMVYEVPAQQYRDRYDVLVPDTYTANYFGLVVPRSAQVLLDDAPLTGAMVEQLGPWDVVHTAVTPGRHRLRTREGVPLGVKVYGTASFTSYMYPGGLDLRQLPPG